MKHKTTKTRVIDPVSAALAILGLFLSLIAIIVTARGTSASVRATNVQTTVEIVHEFQYSKTKQWVTELMGPPKGSLYFEWKQTKGTRTDKYNLAYKKADKRDYIYLREGAWFGYNNYWYGPNFVTKTNGKTKYMLLLEKTNGFQPSIVDVRWKVR